MVVAEDTRQQVNFSDTPVQTAYMKEFPEGPVVRTVLTMRGGGGWGGRFNPWLGS